MWKDNERERNDRAERNKEEDAVRELFHSVLDEIHEEINLQLHHLSPPKLLGIIHQGDALTPSFGTFLAFTDVTLTFHQFFL